MSESGLVVARFRRHVAVETEKQAQVMCLTRGRSLKPLVGDRVTWDSGHDGTAVISAIMPRQSTLTRIDSRGRCEEVAANITQLLIVAAPEPRPDWFLIDRYLVAAQLLPAAAVIVINKCDLIENEIARLDTYRDIGYSFLLVSAKRHTGIEALADVMRGERSVMVGQSGVGKSSLSNALLGEQIQAIGALTEKGKQGRHTTTTSQLVRLPNGAELIDSPGVRSYAPYIETRANIAAGFREFTQQAGRCRFDDCAHVAEPSCAIKAAVEAGTISAERYESYVKLRTMLESLPPPR
jgi:ribosome biogenesis GTPase